MAATLLTEKGLVPEDVNVVCTTSTDISNVSPGLAHRHEYFRDESGTTIFKMLFDKETSTMSYILGCSKTREAVIIDPVLEHVDRDLQAAADMRVTIKYAINTHCHADHVTGTGAMKAKVPSIKSMISSSSGADADIKLNADDVIVFGERTLKVLSTPGHTNGCVSFYDAAMGAVFSGDALMIGGCGRTDFQEGNSRQLYQSVHSQLFSLPDDTLVYPAHDYRGRLVSTIAHERGEPEA